MMTIVRTQERAQANEPEVTTALDELAREGARRMILAASPDGGSGDDHDSSAPGE